jgi:hypothetical protein
VQLEEERVMVKVTGDKVREVKEVRSCRNIWAMKQALDFILRDLGAMGEF